MTSDEENEQLNFTSDEEGARVEEIEVASEHDQEDLDEDYYEEEQYEDEEYEYEEQ